MTSSSWTPLTEETIQESKDIHQIPYVDWKDRWKNVFDLDNSGIAFQPGDNGRQKHFLTT